MGPVVGVKIMPDALHHDVGPADAIGASLTYRVLGELEVHADGQPVHLSGPAQKALLAFLLINANRAVSHDAVAEALWGVDAGYTVKRLQMAITRLRKSLRPLAQSERESPLRTVAGGYVLAVADGTLDVEVFEQRLRAGRNALDARDFERAAHILRQADALWRGRALVDVELKGFAQDEIRRLDELRLDAFEARFEADLALGRHADLIGELDSLAAANPTRDRFAAQLMRALYRCGRQVEALEVYQRARDELARQFGLDPGPELQTMQARILNQDPSLLQDSRSPLPLELDASAAVPLAGRERECRWLLRQWEAAQREPRIISITGPHGIGKTRLAAELAGTLHTDGVTVHYRAADDGTPVDVSGPTLLVADGADAPALEAPAAHVPVLTILLGNETEISTAATLALEPLNETAVSEIAQAYVPRGYEGDPPVAALFEASGGIPGLVHSACRQWARDESARRVGLAAGKTAAGRAELRSMEAELADEVAELRITETRGALADGARDTVMCPFKGLAAFDIDDAGYFYGRERLTAELVARLVGTPLLGVIGPSGSGKSSVVRAGLLPALAEGVLPGSELWQPVVVRPGEHPPQDLEALVGPGQFVLVVDQFEEVFTACESEPERSRFIHELIKLTERPGAIVLALRADQYGRCAGYPKLSRLLAANHVLVPPMTRDEIRRAIECPAEQARLEVEPELTDRLMADVERQPGGLPLLSTALLELWQRRDGRRLRLSAYQETGGVSGAVARLAENAFDRLDETHQAVTRNLLTRLVNETADGSVERRRVPLAELDTERGADVERVLGLLADRRLVTMSDGAVEIAHEALMREWPRLRDWIEQDREGLRIQRALTADADEWNTLGRDDGALYRGAQLTLALEWRAGHDLALNRLEREFLDASAALRRAEQAARRKNVRRAFAALSLVLVLITGVAIVAIEQTREARKQRDITASREIAARAFNVLDTDPGLGLALAREALATEPTAEAAAALRQAVTDFRALSVFQASRTTIRSTDLSPDGSRVVVTGNDGVISVWSLKDRRRLLAIPSRGPLMSARFTPDGRAVVAAGVDGEIAIVDLATHRRRSVLRVPDVVPYSLSISEDGRRLAVGFGDGVTRIVDLDTSEVTEFPGPEAPVFAVALTRDGHRVAVGSVVDGSLRVYDLRHADDPLVAPADSEGVGSVDFSRDGTRLVAGGGGGLVRVLDATTGKVLTTFRRGKTAVQVARFSPDGGRILSTGEDGMIRITDIESRQEISVLRGHAGRVWDAAFNRRGDQIVSGGEDGTVRTWSPPKVRVLSAPALNVSFSPDGSRLVAGALDGSIRIWRASDGRVQQHLTASIGETYAQFSPDGGRVVAFAVDGNVTVWDTETGSKLESFDDYEGQVSAAALDDRGHRLVIGGRDGRVVIRALGHVGAPIAFDTKHGTLDHLALSRDGTLIATSGADGAIKVWRTARPAGPVATLTGGPRNTQLEFDRDGRRLAAAGADGTVRVWSLQSKTAAALRGHTGKVASVAFNKDGSRVVSAGIDGKILVWAPHTREPLMTVHSHAERADGAAFSPDGASVVSTSGSEELVVISSCEACGRLSEVIALSHSRAERRLTAADRERFLVAP
jgi:WD40 repeat protein/DNA-binding SARP family transcriptional activator